MPYPMPILPYPVVYLIPLEGEYSLWVLRTTLFLSLLAGACVTDIRRREIPNWIPTALLVLALSYFSPIKLLGILACLPLLAAGILTDGRMGGGDIKLCGGAGAVLGLWRGNAGLMAGLFLVLLYYAVLKIYTKARGKQGAAIQAKALALPLAPFLSIGFAAAYFLGGLSL